jgi:hypothetical protein
MNTGGLAKSRNSLGRETAFVNIRYIIALDRPLNFGN